MQIYQALKKDHDQLKVLLNQLVTLGAHDKAPDEEEGALLIDQIRDEFIPHSRAEESVFYNSLRSISTADSLALHGFEEHMEAEALFRALEFKDSMDEEWMTTAQEFKTAVEHHIQEEETKVFSAARRLFTVQEAEMMADAFERLKPEVREGSFVQNTLDLIANLMPPRFAAPMRTYTYGV
jgi:hemerythrin-like domain-containing protein